MKLAGAREYLLENGVPSSVNDLILKHLSLKFDQSSIFDEEKMLNCLPTRLSDELYVMNRLSKLQHIPIFEYISNRSVAVYLYKQLEVAFYDHNEYVMREGELVNTLKFLVAGSCVVFKKKSMNQPLNLLSSFATAMQGKARSKSILEAASFNGGKKKKVRAHSYDPNAFNIENVMPGKEYIDILGSLRPGNFFGYLSMLRSSRYAFSIWTTEPTCLYELHKSSIIEILRRYPDVAFTLKTSLIDAIYKQQAVLRKQFSREKRFQFLKQANFDNKNRRHQNPRPRRNFAVSVKRVAKSSKVLLFGCYELIMTFRLGIQRSR